MHKTAIAIRHVAFEGLGLIEPALRQAGYSTQLHDACVDDLRSVDPIGADLLILLGGPVGAHEDDRYPFLGDELRLLERRLAAGRPTLGICLGAQLIARASGCRVFPGPEKEIGWGQVALSTAGRASPLRHLAQRCVLHWHGDTFDLPRDAVLLASTEAVTNQAFSLGRHVLGLQFHAETDGADIERWLVGHACELAGAGLDPCAIRRDAARHGPALAAAGSRMVADWLADLNPS